MARRDGLRVSGLDPAGIFLGKAGALAAELLAIEVLLGVGIVVLYDADLRAGGIALLAATILVATAGLAATGTLYGALAVGGGSARDACSRSSCCLSWHRC